MPTTRLAPPLFVFLALVVASPALLLAQQGPPPSVPQAPAPASAPLPAVSEVPRPDFGQWLADLRQEALARGVSEQTVNRALSGIEPNPVVVERDRTQAERTLPLDEYLRRRLDRKTVRTARAMAKAHRQLAAGVSRKYAVPSSILIAVWGLESNFGRFSGVRPTVAALATLAYDNRRAALFRQELFEALRILDRGDIGLEQMKGSWAGAMGQPQFMPSSYLRFAEDFDGDGRTDIWASRPDVFASIANYLRKQGWQPGGSWGRHVALSDAAAARVEAQVPLRTQGCEALKQMTEPRPWSAWRSLGVRLKPGQRAPAAGTEASLVRAGPRNFLVFDNYHALLQYNCAHAYALSVALLSDSVRGVGPGLFASPGKTAKKKATSTKKATKKPTRKPATRKRTRPATKNEAGVRR